VALALLTMTTLSSYQTAGVDNASHPAKLEPLAIRMPPQLNDKKTIPAVWPVEIHEKPVTKRYGFTEVKDDLEKTVRLSLDIIVYSRWYDAQSGINRADWLCSVVIDPAGKIACELSYSNMATDSVYSLGVVGDLIKDNFRLMYRKDEQLQSAIATAVMSSKQGAMFEKLTWRIEAPQFLDMADAGHIRIKYPENMIELHMDDDDREAIRAFVWQKIPGGEEMIKARYKRLSEKPSSSKN
jgi:hypothetical protein